MWPNISKELEHNSEVIHEGLYEQQDLIQKDNISQCRNA